MTRGSSTRSSTRARLGAQVDDDAAAPPRWTTTVSASWSWSTSTRSSRGSPRSGRSRRSRDQIAVPAQAAARAARWSRSDQSSRDRLDGLLRTAGRVRRPRAQPCAANSSRRPRRTASAIPRSVWSVKYCHGVDAPHSSPMNSIGVHGGRQQQRRAAGEPARRSAWPTAGRRSRGCRPGRGSAATTTNRQPGVRARSTGRPCVRRRNVE